MSNTQKKGFTIRQFLEASEGILIMALCYLTFFLKHYRDHWGMSREELKDWIFPVDDLIPNPKVSFTHGIIINAPADFVWPWIAQIGQGRGGFYSYEGLENLAGLHIYNADIILEAYQQPEIGDLIRFSPKDAYPVISILPGAYMAIENCYDFETKQSCVDSPVDSKKYIHLTWLWYVETLEANKSRFISRNRVHYTSSFWTRLFLGLLAEPIVFAMDRKMCRGIKKRAEQLYDDKKDPHGS